MSILNARRPPQGPVIDVDAQKWRSAVFAGGGTVTALHHARVTRLIRALKAGGVWSSLDRLWLFASENSTQALTDVVARASATATNSPTFTANRGYAGNGTNSYLDTGFNASTAGGNYVQNDAHYGVWVETAHSANARAKYMGNDFGTQYSVLGQLNSTNSENGINVGSPMSNAYGGSKIGHWIVQRTASNALASHQNGTQFESASSASSAVANGKFFVLCTGTLNVPGTFTDGRVSAAHIGKSFSAGQIAAFYNALRTYMTAVGVA